METNKYIFRADRRELNYLRLIIESYDGMAVVKTLDPHEAFIELCVSPGCDLLVLELIDSLKISEGIRLEQVNPPILEE